MCSVPEETVLAKAKEVQLSMSEVKFWLQHLDTIQENRKKGAQKALETRQKRKGTSRRNVKEIQQISEWWCGVVTNFMKMKPRKRKYGLSVASASYGIMWIV